MKNFFKYTLPVVALCALAACSDDDSISNPVDPYNGKELIAFDDNGGGITRAFFNDTKQGFSQETKVYMRIIAQNGTADSYRNAEATATASTNINAAETGEGVMNHYGLVGAHSDLTYVAGQERFWDDAFGRDSKLTVYAFAIPNRTDATLPTWDKTEWTQVNKDTNKNWNTASKNDVEVTWTLSTAQSSTTMDAEDLAYSNNISENGEGGRYTHVYSGDPETLVDAFSMGDGRMEWLPKTKDAGQTSGKFDQGHLIFNHALAWIEINLKEGAGFNNSDNTDFKWSENKTFTNVSQNITLKGFYTKGTFNISDGSWSRTADHNTTSDINDITAMDEKTGDNPAAKTIRQLYAFVVPGNNLYETTNNVVEFEIDEGKYYVTGKQIADAIRDYNYGTEQNPDKKYSSFTTIEAGKHYVINLTVAKKGIDRITAAIVKWETVNSNDADADNTYPTFTFEDRGTRLESTAGGKQFNIYRAAWEANDYITSNDTKDYNEHWTTGWYSRQPK